MSEFGLNSFGMPNTNEGDFYLYNFCKLGAMKGITNVLSTGSHCRGQRSERIIGSVIDTLIKKYGFSREEFLVSTELGQLTDDMITKTPAALVLEDILKDGVLKQTDILQNYTYCIHPAYLKYQINKSLSLMKLKTLDVAMLSNPLEFMTNELDQKEIEYRLAKAFEYLEEMVVMNKIRSYGINSTSALNIERSLDVHSNPETKDLPSQKPLLPLHKISQIAEDVGGVENGFKYISAPGCGKIHLYSLLNRIHKKDKLKYINTPYKAPTSKKPRGSQYISLVDYCKLHNMNYIGTGIPLDDILHSSVTQKLPYLDPKELNMIRSMIGQESVVSHTAT